MPIKFSSLGGSSSNLVQYLTATQADKLHESSTNLDVGVYVITCVSSTISTLELWSDNTYVTTVSTSSGTVTLNLASAVNKIRFWINTGTNVSIGIQKTGSTLVSAAASGTVEVITSNTTYTNTGWAYVVLVGGGGAGGSGYSGNYGGGGGGSGGLNYGFVYLTGNLAVTIGASGVGSPANSNVTTRQSGSATSLGSLLSATGGQGGQNANEATGYQTGAAGTGGSPNGATNGATISSPYPFVIKGTTGSGRTADYFQSYSGYGSGIGTGGIDATGYGAGGSGGSAGGRGGNGSPGAVWILRV